jgi:hypothetical protein
MKRPVMTSLLTTAAMIAIAFLVFLVAGSAAAQSGNGSGAAAAASPGPAPRMPDGHPDLSGVWWPGRDLNPQTSSTRYAAGRDEGSSLIGPNSFGSLYQPWAMAKAKTLSDKDDPALHCIPSLMGPPPLAGNGLVGQIVQTPKFVILLIETYHGFRIVPTDGRPHRDDVTPSYLGDSVGRWEGDTLVVDTTNFNDKNWVHHHGDVSFHSDALHMIERYHRVDANTLEVDVTLEDPKVLTGPWKARKSTLKLAPFDAIMGTICENVETATLMDAASKDNYGRKK